MDYNLSPAVPFFFDFKCMHVKISKTLVKPLGPSLGPGPLLPDMNRFLIAGLKLLISKTEQLTGPAAWLVGAEALPSQVRRTRYATGARAARNLSPTQVSDAPPRALARAHLAQSRHWQCLLMWSAVLADGKCWRQVVRGGKGARLPACRASKRPAACRSRSRP